MKIATYNVNSINARLPVLLHWLAQSKPDVACLQELKAPDEKFPVDAIREAGYEAVWHGQKAWNGVAILARGEKPEETRRGLPGDPDDTHSRYIEAVVGGVTVGCLYLPNGNPAPGPKFDYKLKWFERLQRPRGEPAREGGPVVLAGDYNVIPTERDVYKPERWVDDALFLPETREAYRQLLAQGWTDALRHLHPDETIYTFWDYMRGAFARNAGLRIDHLLLSPALAPRLVACGVDRHIEPADHLVDLAIADRADPAQLLGEDEVGGRGGEGLLVELVERRPAVDRSGHEAMDVARRRCRKVVDAPGQDGLADDLWRIVALVGDADELVTEPDGADDLRRRRQQGGDPHRVPLSLPTERSGSAPTRDGWRPREQALSRYRGLSSSTDARAAALSLYQTVSIVV